MFTLALRKMVNSAKALIDISNQILESVDSINHVEYCKKGRKYKFVQDHFHRVRQEDKHLVVYPQNLNAKMGITLSYRILCGIEDGNLIHKYPDFCLSIVGVANELEVNRWYEEENTSVVNLKSAKKDPLDFREAALEYYKGVTADHISMGLELLLASKVNFIHTDHHIGAKLDSRYIKEKLCQFYGPEVVNDTGILVALKSFTHWGNIKGILYKLKVPSISISAEQLANFDRMPDPSQELIATVKERYPSGTSKYSLIKKGLEIYSDYKYAELIPFPKSLSCDLKWIFELCDDIENDPIRYHLRAATKNLCENPVNLSALNRQYALQTKSLLSVIALLINTFDDAGGEYLLQNSKLPKLDGSVIKEHHDYYTKLLDLRTQVRYYEEKEWDYNDIILRLKRNEFSILNAVSQAHK